MNQEPYIIQLPKFLDPRGNLSFIEDENNVPFKINRTYWIYDVPGGETRGGHAYHQLQEFVVALSGSFDVVLNDGNNEFRFHLNRSYYGLFIPKMYWRSMENFSTNFPSSGQLFSLKCTCSKSSFSVTSKSININ